MERMFRMIRWNFLTHGESLRWTVFLFLFIFPAFANVASAQAVINDKFVGGPMDENGGYEDASKFIIASNGNMFLVCPNGIFGSASQGIGWTLIDSNLSGDFCFGPDSILYLAGAGGVFSSTNFGATWSNLSNELPNGPFYSVIATVNGTIFTGCPEGVFRSSDNGVDWVQVAQSEISASAGLWLTTTLTGTVMARNGNAYFRSTDNGDTWASSVPLTTQIWPVTDSDILRQGSNGSVERSTDDGASWKLISGLPAGNPWDIAMDQGGNLFAFFAWQLYISTDGGTTWSVFGTIEGGGEELAFSPNHTLYFSQESEGIWRTLTPLSGVSTPQGQLGSSLELVPNGSSGTLLSFTLSVPTYATLSLFDVLGNKVMTLAEGKFSVGQHQIRLQNTIPSGAYFCVLRTGADSKILNVLLQ